MQGEIEGRSAKKGRLPPLGRREEDGGRHPVIVVTTSGWRGVIETNYTRGSMGEGLGGK